MCIGCLCRVHQNQNESSRTIFLRLITFSWLSKGESGIFNCVMVSSRLIRRDVEFGNSIELDPNSLNCPNTQKDRVQRHFVFPSNVQLSLPSTIFTTTNHTKMTKIAIVHYSLYGHVATMSESVKKGVLAVDGVECCDIFSVPETLSDEILAKMHAPPKDETKYPVIASADVLKEYDGILFGISGRYGMVSAQMKVRFVYIHMDVCVLGSSLPIADLHDLIILLLCLFVMNIYCDTLFVTVLYGFHGPIVANGRFGGQGGRLLFLHGRPRRRPGNDWLDAGHVLCEHGHGLRAARLRGPQNVQSRRSPRRVALRMRDLCGVGRIAHAHAARNRHCRNARQALCRHCRQTQSLKVI